CFLATSTPGALSASRRILTICSSLNLVFFMVISLPERPLSQSINWTENRPAGHRHLSAQRFGGDLLSEARRRAAHRHARCRQAGCLERRGVRRILSERGSAH